MIDARQHIIGKLYGFDFENITVGASPIGLTASKLTASPKPKEVFIMCESAQCRYRYDSTDPDATTGFVLNPYDILRMKGTTNLNNLKFIRTGANSAKLHICYER